MNSPTASTSLDSEIDHSKFSYHARDYDEFGAIKKCNCNKCVAKRNGTVDQPVLGELPLTSIGAAGSNSGRLFIAMEGAIATHCDNDLEREKLCARLINSGPQWVKENLQRMRNEEMRAKT